MFFDDDPLLKFARALAAPPYAVVAGWLDRARAVPDAYPHGVFPLIDMVLDDDIAACRALVDLLAPGVVFDTSAPGDRETGWTIPWTDPAAGCAGTLVEPQDFPWDICLRNLAFAVEVHFALKTHVVQTALGTAQHGPALSAP